MQLITLAAVAAAAFSATVSADVNDVSFNNNASCNAALPNAKIVNRCPYTVYAWSVVSDSQYDCDEGAPAVIPPGGFYAENYRRPAFGGISIKLSKDKQCKHGSITQLEYHLEENSDKYNFNSLDVSFVDCQNRDCPTINEGYYLISGNQDGQYPTKGDGSICPILSCTDYESCAKCSYILPDDVQTKTCDNEANLVYYMCGGHAPGEGDSTPAPSSSSSEESKPSKTYEYQPSITSTAVKEPDVAAAAAAAATTEAPAGPNVKTEIVYETVYVKRHAHGRRHQHFHA